MNEPTALEQSLKAHLDKYHVPTDLRTAADVAVQARHDELLRMRCLEISWSNSGSAEVIASDFAEARGLYREVTGRNWPARDAESCSVCGGTSGNCMHGTYTELEGDRS